MSTNYNELLNFEDKKSQEERSTALLMHIVYGEKENEYTKHHLKNNFTGMYLELARLALHDRGVEVEPIVDANINSSLNRIHERLDCADFVIPGFLVLLYKYSKSPLLSQEILSRIEDEVLNFKYWIDEPGVDVHCPCYFTENHQILFHAIEYLAGQLYPDRIFTNNGETGEWHKEHGRTYLNRWLTWRKKFGFSEWLSNVYYAEDLLGLVVLAQLADEEEIKTKASMLIDLLLFDIAVNSFKGVMGGTNGRGYNGPTMNPRFSGTSAVSKLMWNVGYAETRMDLAATVMAVFNYKCSNTIAAIAKDTAAVVENRERMSFNVEDSHKYGIDPANFDNIMLYWSLHTFYHKLVIENSRKFCPSWYHMNTATEAHLEKYQLSEAAGIHTDPDPNCSALTQVDIYTYKTKNYMLGCAQDYRKGRTNFQQHVWQASLGDKAVVFTTHPGADNYTGRPNYFVGNGNMPKAVAHKNVAIVIYRTPAESMTGLCSHAYFPQHEFDEVIEQNGWIFGRKDGGYIALRSLKKGSWREKDINLFKSIYDVNWKEEFDRAENYEFWVAGHSNVWVCEMGERETHGSFNDFVAAISIAKFEGDSFEISYQSPFLGEMKTGWSKPLTVNGDIIKINDYDRYDNPYCKADFGTDLYEITYGDKKLKLDFANNVRSGE